MNSPLSSGFQWSRPGEGQRGLPHLASMTSAPTSSTCSSAMSSAGQSSRTPPRSPAVWSASIVATSSSREGRNSTIKAEPAAQPQGAPCRVATPNRITASICEAGSTLIFEFLPSRDELVATIEADQTAGDLGGVLEDCPALLIAELHVLDVGAEVMLAK